MKKLVSVFAALLILCAPALADEWRIADFLTQYLDETTAPADLTAEEFESYIVKPDISAEVGGVTFTVNEMMFDGINLHMVIDARPVNDDMWLASNYGWDDTDSVTFDNGETVTLEGAAAAANKRLTYVSAFFDHTEEDDMLSSEYSEKFYPDGHIQLYSKGEFAAFSESGCAVSMKFKVGDEEITVPVEAANNVPFDVITYGETPLYGTTCRMKIWRTRLGAHAVFDMDVPETVPESDSDVWTYGTFLLYDAETGEELTRFGNTCVFRDAEGKIVSGICPGGLDTCLAPVKETPEKIKVEFKDPYEKIIFDTAILTADEQ